MLACPRCREVLKPVAMLGGFLWACPTCGGRAGTLTLLEHRTPRAALSALRRAARAADRGLAVSRNSRNSRNSTSATGGTADPSEPYLGYGPDGESGWLGATAAHCPSCARPVPRVAVPAHGIADALDVCPRCDLVWFERTAMSALPLKPTLPARPRPYARRASPAEAGRPLAWRHDRAAFEVATPAARVAPIVAPAAPTRVDAPGAPLPTARRRSCAGRVLLLVAIGVCLGATLASAAPHALRDAWPAALAVAEHRWADLLGGAVPFLAAVLVTGAFWTSARRRHRRRTAGFARPT